MEEKEEKEGKWHGKVWFTATLIGIFVTICIVCTYYYYRTPVYKYPKLANTYKISKKTNQTPDGTIMAFLKSVHENDADLCRNVVPTRIFELYGVYYYHGVFNDDKIRYLLSTTNEMLKKDYGENWFDNLEVEEVEKKKIENISVGIIKAKVGDKDLKLDIAAAGFDDKYQINGEDMNKLFDPMLKDENKRPKE